MLVFRGVFFAVLLTLAGFGLVDIGQTLSAEPQTVREAVNLPDCREDEAGLIGRGDFENGRWERYECLHIDHIKRDAR